MKDYSNKNNNSDVRICIHEYDDKYHPDMILLQHKFGITLLINISITPVTLFSLLKENSVVFLFDDNGNIIYSCILSKNEIFKTPKNIFHSIMPLSRKVIYHESKEWPSFRMHLEIPKWCPSQ